MELIAIGKISRPVGTKGEIKIIPLTDNLQRFETLKKAWVGPDENNAELFKVKKIRIDSRQVVACFDGVEKIDEAEQLRDNFLFVPEKEAIKLVKGRYFIDDVIGCEVMTEEKEKVGIVSDLLSLPANDVWVIKNGTKEFLIPAVKDIVKHVDIEKKYIVIHALEGLLD